MFVYWGGNNSGKSHLKRALRLNNKSYTDFYRCPYIIKKTTIDGDTMHRTYYYKEDNIIKSLCEVEEYSLDFKYCEVVNFADDRVRTRPKNPTKEEIIRNGWYNKTKQIFDPITTKDLLSLDLNSYLWIAPYPCFNIIPYKARFDSSSISVYNSPLTEKIRTANNFIVIKSNLVDSCISKLNMYHPDLMKDYTNDRKKIWNYLDTFFDTITNTRALLEKNNIEYKEFDLDTSSYSLLGLNKELPRSYTHPNIDETSKEYGILKSISKEYLDTRFQRQQSNSSDI